MLKLSSYLSPKRVSVIKAVNKNNAILQSLELFRDCQYIIDFEKFCIDILNRESLLATGIGLGIGVPHVRSNNIREPVSSFTVLEEPVKYGSFDGIDVKVILVVAMPDGAEQLYLQYLAKISMFFSNEEKRNTVMNCTDTDELIKIIQVM